MQPVDQPRAVDQPFPEARVVVTGGTRGIGAGIARAFLHAGTRVLVCGRAQTPSVDAVLALFPRATVIARLQQI